jgi:hypothetical protein
MAVTDDQVAALRTYLSARTGAEVTDARRQFFALSRSGRLDEVGALVSGAFAAAARRRFSPTWTSAEIVRFVAGFRSSSAEAAGLLSPSAAENQLREVLGDEQGMRPPEEERARAQFLLLAALSVTLDARELDEVLAEGRALADSLIATGLQALPDLASAPKPGKPGPGRPPGSKNHRPATRHDVGKTVKREEPQKGNPQAEGLNNKLRARYMQDQILVTVSWSYWRAPAGSPAIPG